MINSFLIGGTMSRWKRKKILWKKKKCKKKHRKKLKNKKVNYYIYDNSDKSERQWNPKEFSIDVPENFSIVENEEEVLGFFNDIIEEIREKHFCETFFFDFKNVKKITIDAIMYLLAVMGNTGNSRGSRVFSGNAPDDESARKVLIESGFYNYVYSPNVKKNYNKNKKIQIYNGDNVDTSHAKLICDFVNENCITKKKYTSDLYEVLIELMTNTVQHAYCDDEVWKRQNWYIFIEDRNQWIQFTFLDIGAGIPQTIQKSRTEKIINTFKITDAQYINSAMNGEFRTQTNCKNRGNGLPTVKKYAMKDEIGRFIVFSGNGICKFEGLSEQPKEINAKRHLHGTLFSWNIMKDVIKEEYK